MDVKHQRLVEQLLSALPDIRPLSRPPAKQEFKGALDGWSGRVLLFQGSAFSTLVMGLMLENLSKIFFPHQSLAPIITLLFVPAGLAYCGYLVIAEIGEWRNRESLVNANRIQERKHDASDIDKLLAYSRDIGLLKETRLEVNAELEKLKNESSVFSNSLIGASSLLLAVVALHAIVTGQRAENVRTYPTALALGSIFVILGFVLRFPVYRRIRLYSYWSYILEKAIHHQEGSRTNARQ